MFCTKCGTPNSDDALFCSKCGNKLNNAEIETGNQPDNNVMPSKVDSSIGSGRPNVNMDDWGSPSDEKKSMVKWIVIGLIVVVVLGIVFDMIVLSKASSDVDKIMKESDRIFEESDRQFNKMMKDADRDFERAYNDAVREEKKAMRDLERELNSLNSAW